VKGGIAESVESYLVMFSAYVSSLLFDGFPETDEVLEGDSGMDRYAAHRCNTTLMIEPTTVMDAKLSAGSVRL
jgi:hypothetical protein